MNALLLMVAVVLTADDVNLNKCEAAMFKMVNVERVRHGLPKLTIDPVLQSSTRRHCRWMARTGGFKHSDVFGAENIAEGHKSATSAFEAWMTSRGGGHKRNILDIRVTRVGVAGYVGRNGKNYYVQQFTR